MRLALLLVAALASGCAPRIASPPRTATPVSVPGVPASAAAAPAVLNGAVTARMPLALPAGAVVTVLLVDLATLTRVGEQTIRPTGEAALPFAIPYSLRAIDPAGRYGVRAEIHDAAGLLLWSSPSPAPVFTNGAPLDGVEVEVQRVVRPAGP